MNNNYDSAVALTKTQCPYCGEIADGDLVINRRLTPSAKIQELHGKVVDFKTCGTCQGALDQGAVFLIEIDPERSRTTSSRGGNLGTADFESAYRTGKMWALKEEAVKRAIPDVVIPKQRIIFIDEEGARAMFGPMYDSQQTGE